MTADTLTPNLEDQLRAAVAHIEFLSESLADVEASFAREDAGWSTVGGGRDEAFTAKFRKARTAHAKVAATVDPLIKRGLNLRVGYLWSGGVQVSVRDDASTGQDVGAVVTTFWDDEDVRETFSSLQALIEHERQFATAGEVMLALPTDQRSGRVRVRSLPPAEITDIIYDPEDATRPWYYQRTYTPATPGAPTVTVLHPSLSYRPGIRPARHDSHPIRWDAPLLHVAVNKVSDRGVGDLWAALPWAKAYNGFLTDWAGLMRALSKIAMVLRTRGDRTQQAAARLSSVHEVGSGLAVSPTEQLEALSTSGARFDADSGRPLAVMVAAALDIPVTTLLGDPGATGARAVAENVTAESWATFEIRQDLWASIFQRVIGYVIDCAVIAPGGPLRGTIVRDGDRQYAQLPDDDSRTIMVAFPAHDNTATLDKVQAIVGAVQTETIPPLTIARLLLEALEVPDMDEVLALVTDEDTGAFIPLDIIEQRVRDRLAERGEG